MNKSLIIVFIAFISIRVSAQFDEDLARIKNRFPQSRHVILNKEEHVKIELKNGVPVVFSDNLVRRMALDEKVLGLNEQSVTYKEGYQQIEGLEAFTYAKEGNSYRKIKADEIKISDHLSNEIFYDGVKKTKIIFPSVTKGAVMELKYRELLNDHRFLGGFHFKSYSPVIKSVYTVTFPQNIKVAWKFIGDSSMIKFSKVKKKNNWVYTWEGIDLPEMKRFGSESSVLKYEPHLYLYVEGQDTEKGHIKYMGNVKELFKFESSYLKKLNKDTADPQLMAVVDSIKKVSKNTKEQIKNTFYWAQDNIKYIAFEDGIGGLRPREANDVLIKRFGDCKDIANMISYMLKQQGIPSYLTWIGTRSLPYTYDQLPLIYSSNHMITAVHVDNEWIFLDGTAKNCTYKFPTEHIQGKEAMIAISPDSFTVATVPVIPPKYNLDKDSIAISIVGKNLECKGTMRLEGFAKNNFVDGLYYVSTQKKEDAVKEFLEAGNNKCVVKDFQLKNEAKKDSALKIKYALSITDYIKEIDNEVYINLHLRKRYNEFLLDTANSYQDHEFQYCLNDQFINQLQVPAGYKVKKIPAGVKIDHPKYAYSVDYIQKNNKILLKESFVLKDILIDRANFKDFRSFIEKVINQQKQLVVLTKM